MSRPLVILESPYAARDPRDVSAAYWREYEHEHIKLEDFRPPVLSTEHWRRYDRENNVLYARNALLDSIGRGESPIAPHLLYPQILDDDKLDERTLGIECGLAWLRVAARAVFYTDRGWSHGMLAARQLYEIQGKPFELRSIGC